MFTRPQRTYESDESLIQLILNDETNPLHRIARLIPPGAKVLDIGAGNGLLGQILHALHADMIVDGIEPDSYAAQIAQREYRNLYTGMAQDFLPLIAAEKYDVVVLADVIEHMNDPLAFLRELSACLGETARIVLSVPNVAFGAVRLALMDGAFAYTDSGLIERTHLRFFTLQTLRELVAGLGLQVERLIHLQKDLGNSEVRFDATRIPLAAFRHVVRDNLSFTYQFLLVLSARPAATEESRYGRLSRFPVLKFLLERHGLLGRVRKLLRRGDAGFARIQP